jgi:hypothetical protein
MGSGQSQVNFTNSYGKKLFVASGCSIEFDLTLHQSRTPAKSSGSWRVSEFPN